MPNAGLDVEKLSLLAKWGEGLQRDQRAEVAAAGKAILMLIEEVERLHVVVWDGRLDAARREPEPDLAIEFVRPAQEGELEDLPSLLDRLRRRLSGAAASR